MKTFWTVIFAAALVVFSAGCLSGCLSGCTFRRAAGDVLVVSIEPLKYLVDNIVGDDFEVAVLVPAGASPENYEPTPSQIRAAESARLVFFTGLIDFERALVTRLPQPERFVDLSEGIEVMAGTCSHGHGHAHGGHNGHGGIDPHIWVSPRELSKMAATAYKRIHEAFPDSVAYTVNYRRLAESLRALDNEAGAKISASGTRAFLIFHPGLTYYARDYGLEQIALESDGKEPSVGRLQQIVTRARAEKITTVLYQKEFPVRAVEVAAAEIGATPAEIDILSYDITGNILKITDLIAGQK